MATVKEKDMEDFLSQVIFDSEDDDITCYGEYLDTMKYVTIKSVRSFEDAGILTSNKGLVITLVNNQEFQITIVRSR